MTTLLSSLGPLLNKSGASAAGASINSTNASSSLHGDAASSKRLPILIIPGFMSSGLEVKSSTLEPEWVGDRLWLDLKRLGIASKTSKDHWVQHMMLQPENRIREQEGLQVRAVEGIAGVAYMDNASSFSKFVSYVFAPLIKALKKYGYQDGVDLEAAPYDWRLPPSELEQRDQYFSKTIETVERLYKENDNTPVVLLCHSMGCKVGHYFLNLAQDRMGQDWIDQHIHSYMPVGAPHLGASNTIRGLICGDKMGLEAFLSSHDAIRLARSWGSVPWLMPMQLPLGATPPSFIRPTGRLFVKPIWPTDPYTLQYYQQSREIKLSVVFGSHVLTKTFHSQNGKVEEDTFSFATDPDAPTVNGQDAFLMLVLLNPHTNNNDPQADCLLKVVTCPIKACCILPCEKWFRCLVPQQYLITKQVLAEAIDDSAITAGSDLVHISSLLKKDDEQALVTEQIQLRHAPCLWVSSWNKPRLRELTLEIQWQPFVLNDDNSATGSTQGSAQSSTQGDAPCSTAGSAKSTIPVIAEVHPDTPSEEVCSKPFESVPPYRIVSSLHQATLKSAQAITPIYNDDPFEPRGPRSAGEAPPVQKVKAVYGINIPTEVGACYSARPAKMVSESTKKSVYVLDEKAELAKTAKKNGYRLKGGVLEETKDTIYQVPTTDGSSEERKCSGDGTVPYWSLQHARTWQSDTCQVEVNEIEKADHRDILKDERFHKIVVDYCVVPSSSSSLSQKSKTGSVPLSQKSKTGSVQQV